MAEINSDTVRSMVMEFFAKSTLKYVNHSFQDGYVRVEYEDSQGQQHVAGWDTKTMPIKSFHGVLSNLKDVKHE